MKTIVYLFVLMGVFSIVTLSFISSESIQGESQQGLVSLEDEVREVSSFVSDYDDF